MSTFAVHRRRVLDPTLSPRRRHHNLANCLEKFAPYGFLATYDHLRHSAGRRGRLDTPDALVRAVEELHAARELWVPAIQAYADRRVREKAQGQRRPRPGESWLSASFGWFWLARCPNPRHHPAGPLPEVMAGMISRTPVPAGVCRACGRVGEPITWYAPNNRPARLCPTCGVAPPEPWPGRTP